ncbi:hypothetical protein SAMN05216282_11144 [Cryobacterium psychrotolerans]|uniref:Uncharacterized protein n=1 Tax=Cryobacterium psychrotolerans TaxID=386301 RepID=A0A1G9E6E0_9MICO|nr:hypothetical protein [Cryobacterium psychrotolerans]TFD86408.1 hypothetical protein E3T56_07440 [Cryobacterium psychrotolerans]SDK71627.1 hypothetical protein SAMN05216282_11144 [Cryobacterium psychrotolerans]
MPHANPKLDPRTGLPEYTRDGRSQFLERALAETAAEFQTATNTLAQRLDAVADEFAEAFEAEDKRRATLARIQNTANPDIERLHRERKQRRA